MNQRVGKHVQVNGYALLWLFFLAIFALCVEIGLREVVERIQFVVAVEFETISIQVLSKCFHYTEKIIQYRVRRITLAPPFQCFNIIRTAVVDEFFDSIAYCGHVFHIAMHGHVRSLKFKKVFLFV